MSEGLRTRGAEPSSRGPIRLAAPFTIPAVVRVEPTSTARPRVSYSDLNANVSNDFLSAFAQACSSSWTLFIPATGPSARLLPNSSRPLRAHTPSTVVHRLRTLLSIPSTPSQIPLS